MKRRNHSGITLIALIITIIVLLILAGIAINLTIGGNGIFRQIEVAKKEHEKAQLKEELELKIMDLETERLGEIKLEDIVERFKNLEIQITTEESDGIEGEYKNYEFIVDAQKQVIIGGKLKGEKPRVLIGSAVDNESGKIKIQVIANGEIQSIEAMNDAKLMVENSKSNKIFEVVENGTYKFKVVGTNGRITIGKVIVNNDEGTIEAESILEGISNINSSGIKKIKINEKTEEYSINTILYEGDMEIDGNTQLIGSILNESTYEFGSANDVATQTQEAKNTVLLKVNGNLTIKKDVTLTSCKSNSGYGGPKGMIIYCTQTYTNNGTTTMTARGAKAKGEDVYLWKNEDNSYEYIPSVGGLGGSVTGGTYSSVNGIKGSDGTNRRTAGGGSGGARGGSTKSGAGGNGTSYSGGTGGGGVHGDSVSAASGSSIGGAGGNACILENASAWTTTGGVGNPGGQSRVWKNWAYLNSSNGANGTGGLLIIFANVFNNNNEIEAKGIQNIEIGVHGQGGSSGGGSINIFYHNLISKGNIDASGGIATGLSAKGGAGGTGSITIGNIESGSFECEYKDY